MVQIITNKDTVVVYENNIKVDNPIKVIERTFKEDDRKSPMLTDILQTLRKKDF